MDILISSNLERLLYLSFGANKCAAYMKALADNGKYRITPEELDLLRESFVGYSASEDECRNTVKEVYEKHRKLIDTHTAVAVYAAEKYMRENESAVQMLVVSTASPYKFATDVYESVTGERPEDDLKSPSLLEQKTGVKMPEPLRRVLLMEAIHKDVIDREKMKESVTEFVIG